MTTNPTYPKYRLHRRERRHIPPFGDGSNPNFLSNSLDRLLTCRFAPFPSHNLTDEDRYVLASDEVERPIAPRFEITVARADSLPNVLGASVKDFDLGISVRNRYTRVYRVLARWPLADTPEMWSPDAAKLKSLQTGRGMDFVISVIVSASRLQLADMGMSLGRVIVRKELSVKEPETDSLSFPSAWIEFGGNSSYPKESLWHIEWHIRNDDDDSGSPFALPVEQALTVYLNRAADPQLTAISQVAGAEGLAWRILAAEIITQIWAVVLKETQNEPDANDTDTLAGQTFAHLSRVSEMPYSELRALAEPDSGLTELRHLVSQLLGVVR